jgi:hypothetical protein
LEKTGKKRPWKSQERFPLSHSFNNNKLDDRDHFQQNAKTSVASLRGLIGSSRNIDRHHSGMLIDFIGIPINPRILQAWTESPENSYRVHDYRGVIAGLEGTTGRKAANSEAMTVKK